MPVLASLQELELRILHGITCDLASPLADAVANYAQDVLFGASFLVLLVLLVATTARGRARVPRVLLTALLALGAVHLVREAFWRLAPRDRPGLLFSEDRILRGSVERATCAESPGKWVERAHPPKEPSFPSSHVITCAAVAAALTAGARWAGALAWIYALLVGFGRLYWGKHWPSDVLGALLLGALAGWAAWKVAGGIERRIRPRPAGPPPGPSAGTAPA